MMKRFVVCPLILTQQILLENNFFVSLRPISRFMNLSESSIATPVCVVSLMVLGAEPTMWSETHGT